LNITKINAIAIYASLENLNKTKENNKKAAAKTMPHNNKHNSQLCN